MRKPRKTFYYECLLDTLGFAEYLGWKEPYYDQYNADIADALEGDAIDHIRKSGYRVLYPQVEGNEDVKY